MQLAAAARAIGIERVEELHRCGDDHRHKPERHYRCDLRRHAGDRHPELLHADHSNGAGPATFLPYKRDERLVRQWAIPGTRGLEHRIGGLEKEDVTGNVSYDAMNHEHMVHTRAKKIANIANDIPPLEVTGPADGDLLVIGWGGTYGSITSAVERAQRKGRKVAHAHLRYLSPMPKNTGDVLRRYKKVLVPELNAGQLLLLLRGGSWSMPWA